MNWSAIVSSLTSPRSIINAVGAFVSAYGFITLLHLPHAWLVSLAVVVGNQIGLHQTQPGA